MEASAYLGFSGTENLGIGKELGAGEFENEGPAQNSGRGGLSPEVAP